ncbi:hypothetical protein ADL12_34100 [Streptomyces regalis]|uniref:Nudix hydrolase domain-containing protein n=1 Tax=Streptomyces regalis TaxID=68262 RepID=A0A101JF69_9ACTN|nr:hypothetical protein ADL12_34100 [Streptomyces regalis]
MPSDHAVPASPSHLPVDRWQTGTSTNVYSSRWVSLDLVDVMPPNGRQYQHHVIAVPPAVAVVLVHPKHGVLLLHRHRFITDTVGFEVPAGGIDPGETVEEAAAREVLEETGWKVTTTRHFYTGNASDGVSTQQFHFVLARAAEYVGEPVDAHESSTRQWFPPSGLAELLRTGQVPGCLSSVALLYALQFDLLGGTGSGQR